MREGFYTNLRTAELFFRIVKLYRVTDYNDKVLLMRKIAARNKDKVKYIRDAETYIQNKRVLKLRNPYETE